MKKEIKSLILPFDFKSVGEPDDNGYVEFEGYAAAFDNVDLGKDVIVKGAFAETIKADMNWPILLDHMSYMTETAGYNLSAAEDNYGLKIRGQLNTKVEAGKIVYELSKQALSLGKQIGLSIGYSIQEKDTDEDTMIRTLKKIKMYEYSFTNFPMNPKASITTMKDKQAAVFKKLITEVLEEKGLIEGEDEPSAEGDKAEGTPSAEDKELIDYINSNY